MILYSKIQINTTKIGDFVVEWQMYISEVSRSENHNLQKEDEHEKNRGFNRKNGTFIFDAVCTVLLLPVLGGQFICPAKGLGRVRPSPGAD